MKRIKTLSALILLLIAGSSMAAGGEDDSPEKKFWAAFKAKIPDGDSLVAYPNLFSEIPAIAMIDPAISIGTQYQNTEGIVKYTVYVTANGKKDKFDLVKKVVKAAPKIPNLEITMFYPGGYLPEKIVFDGDSVEVKDIYFNAIGKKKDIELTLYLKKIPEERKTAFYTALSKLVYDFVGEWNYVHITAVKFVDIETQTSKENLVPFSELAGSLDLLLNSAK